jgi:hypothetical protein
MAHSYATFGPKLDLSTSFERDDSTLPRGMAVRVWAKELPVMQILISNLFLLFLPYGLSWKLGQFL